MHQPHIEHFGGTMNARLATAAVAAAILLVGCSTSNVETTPTAEQTPSPVAHATPDSSPAPTPEVAEPTKEEAAQQYLDLVQPVNDVIGGNQDAWNKAFDANDWQQMSALAAASLDAERAFADGLIDASWPEDVAPLVDKMVSQTATEMAWYAGLANATTETDFWNAFGAGGDFDRSSAQELRIRLGLDNVS